MKRLTTGLFDERNRALFVSGFVDTLPVQVGLFPFGIIVGVTAVELGFATSEITIMSAVAFAGAAQLAAIFLMADSVHFILVMLTAVMINIRYTMYSISLAPIFQSYSRLRKGVYSFLITDPTYALSLPLFRDPEAEKPHWYYFGSGVSMWVFWVLGTAIGASLGIEIPDAFPIGLVLPLVFIGLLFPVVEDRPSAATAVVAGGVAAAAAPLDYNLGLLVGVGSGLLVGGYLNR
jgi:4-azaleucine resistance transporter AzlC